MLASAVLLAALVPAAEESPAANRHVLFLGLDGVRTDALAKADTPHLDRLIAEGSFSDNCRIFPDRYRQADTVSGPGWSSIFTGVWADKHGVLGNGFAVTRFDRYPHLFERLNRTRPEMRTASFVTWKPIAEQIVSAADVSEVWEPDGKRGDYAAEDARVCAAATAEIAAHGTDLCVAYFGQIDIAGHTHGFHPSVPQYLSAISRVDAHVGTLLAAIETRREKFGEEWLIVAGTDHGGRGTGHGDSHQYEEVNRVWLLVSGDGATTGRIEEPTALVDLVPTALAYLGVPLDPAWELDGRVVGLTERGTPAE